MAFFMLSLYLIIIDSNPHKLSSYSFKAQLYYNTTNELEAAYNPPKSIIGGLPRLGTEQRKC